MKRILLIATLVFASMVANAKKVKFSVDMTGTDLLGTSVNIMGDFQVVAGLATDNFTELTPLTKEGTSNIYSIIVEIPAFQKYEYRFINGDQTYDSEFIPLESRVNLFNDNRWIYVDSTSSDTLDIGAIVFAGNAPAGKKLVRFAVDAQNISVNLSGIHVGVTDPNLTLTSAYMYSFENNIYEAIMYLTDGSYEYRYFNGTTQNDAETISGSCTSSFGNRSLALSDNTVLETVCFAACTSCEQATGINETEISASTVVYPNPSTDGHVTIKSGNVKISDITGKIVFESTLTSAQQIKLQTGFYTVSVVDENQHQSIEKLVVSN